MGYAFSQTPIAKTFPSSMAIDPTLPTFAGLVSVTPADDGSFTLAWALGTSPKPPLQYECYVALGQSVPAVTLFQNSNILLISPNGDTHMKMFTIADDLTYFVKGQWYTFGVRAVDAYSFEDSNGVTISSQAIASGNLAAVFQTLLDNAVTGLASKLSTAHFDSDARLNNLDATISSRATQTIASQILGAVQSLSGSGGSQLVVPGTFTIPPVGTEIYRLYFLNYPGGAPLNPAVGPTIAIYQQDGVTPIVAPTLMTNESTGIYYYDYSISVGAYADVVIIKTSHQNLITDPAIISVNEIRQQPEIDPNIAAAVWDTSLSLHTVVGSFGANAQNPPLSPSQITSAVWDEPQASHIAAGSLGKSLAQAATASLVLGELNMELDHAELDMTVQSNELNMEIIAQEVIP